MSIADNFDYNLIKTLVLVFETRSMRKAAQILGVSAPTLSYSLNKIRDFYNDPLFIKTAHGFKTTAVAKQLYPLFKKIDDEIRLAVSVDNRDAQNFRNVSIRTNTLVEFFLTNDLFNGEEGNLGLSYEFNNRLLTDEQRIGSIISRDADIDIGPEIRTDNSLVCTHLFTSTLIVLCGRRHPRVGDEITKEQWLNETHASASVFEGFFYSPSSFNELLAKRTVGYKTTSIMNICHCLETSEMIMVFPEYFIRRIMERFALRCVKMPWLNEGELTMYAYTHARSKGDERLKTIIDFLKQD